MEQNQSRFLRVLKLSEKDLLCTLALRHQRAFIIWFTKWLITVLTKPRVAISACLLGETVRYDGRHAREPLADEALAPHVTWVPV